MHGAFEKTTEVESEYGVGYGANIEGAAGTDVGNREQVEGRRRSSGKKTQL